MAKALSVDLRSRVVRSVTEDGLSCRKAAGRFGVSVSSAIRWVQAFRVRGDVAPKPQGGDQRSGRIEALADEILAHLDAHKDLTLEDMVAWIEAEHGERFAVSTLHRFFGRHGISFKKNGTRRRTGPAGRGHLQERVFFTDERSLRPGRRVWLAVLRACRPRRGAGSRACSSPVHQVIALRSCMMSRRIL